MQVSLYQDAKQYHIGDKARGKGKNEFQWVKWLASYADIWQLLQMNVEGMSELKFSAPNNSRKVQILTPNAYCS